MNVITLLAYFKIVSELLTAICHHLCEMMLDKNVSEMARQSRVGLKIISDEETQT